MRAYVKITGLDEKVAALRAFGDQLPDVIHASLVEGTEDVSQALGNYPAQAPSIARRPRPYTRTYAYRDSRVTSYPNEMTGLVETPIDYAVYLRGDGENYEGAYMHVGIWESISAIVERMQTQIEDIFNRRIEGLIYRIFGQ